jgi:3D (Asp-Asp-Asp) domain-containing protein
MRQTIRFAGALVGLLFVTFCVFDAGRMSAARDMRFLTTPTCWQGMADSAGGSGPELVAPGLSINTTPLLREPAEVAGPAGAAGQIAGGTRLRAEPAECALRRPAQRVRMLVTAYCPCEICCGRFADGITASGEPVTANGGAFVAADRGLGLPFGSRVIVPGYANGRAVPVLDVMGRPLNERARQWAPRRLDVFFADHQAAIEWGVRELEVQIIAH